MWSKPSAFPSSASAHDSLAHAAVSEGGPRPAGAPPVQLPALHHGHLALASGIAQVPPTPGPWPRPQAVATTAGAAVPLLYCKVLRFIFK